jgi:hypothetical protein
VYIYNIHPKMKGSYLYIIKHAWKKLMKESRDIIIRKEKKNHKLSAVFKSSHVY